MQVSRIWQEIADHKAENHGSSIGSNTFSPFYFDIINLSCSVINCKLNHRASGDTPDWEFPQYFAGALYIDTFISPTFYHLLTVVRVYLHLPVESVLTVYTW